MAEGQDYNYYEFDPKGTDFEVFKALNHAGEAPMDFTLPSIDGGTVTLSGLRGKPVVIEFGSIT